MTAKNEHGLTSQEQLTIKEIDIEGEFRLRSSMSAVEWRTGQREALKFTNRFKRVLIFHDDVLCLTKRSKETHGLKK